MSRGDAGGLDDLERAVELAGADSRLETRVRCLVNAAGSTFRLGRPDQVERFVATGLSLADDCEFYAGRYRLRLTRAAAWGASGAWERAIGELEDLLRSPGEPGLMAPLARSILARLLARRGDPDAAGVLEAARVDPLRAHSAFVSAVLEVAATELGWLDGSLGHASPAAQDCLRLTTEQGFTVVAAELTAYLRRAEVPVPDPPDPPGPWRPTLAGHVDEAATAWDRIGERYEAAVVLAGSSEPAQRDRGLRRLSELGATATLAAL